MRPIRAIAVALIAYTAIAMPAGAQSPPPGTPSFVVDAISPYAGQNLPLDVRVTVHNAGTVPLGDADIQLTIYDRVGSRSALRQALDGNPREDVLAFTTERLATPLQPGERRAVDIKRDVSTLTNVFQSSSADGVYPIGIAFRSNGNTLQTVVTAEPFFFVPPAAGDRLNVVWIDPIHRPAAFDARGAYPPGSIDRDVQPSGVLGGAVQALTGRATVPVTLAVTGVTVDQARAIAAGFKGARGSATVAVPSSDPAPLAARDFLAALRDAASGGAEEVASTTYADADAVGLLANGLTAELQRQIDLGASTVSAAIGRPPASDLFIPAGYHADARLLAALAGDGYTTVAIAPEDLPPQRDSLFGYDAPVTLAGSSGVTLTGLVVDPAIRDRLANEPDPVLAVQGVVAETAGSYFERPALAAQRVLVVASARTLDPRAAAGLAATLPVVPWVVVRTPSDLLSGRQPVTPTPDKIVLAPAGASRSRPLAAASAARRAFAALDSVLVDHGSPLDVVDRYILSSESEDWSSSPARGVALADAGRAIADSTLGQIRSPARQVTLTSRVAQIPVTILNDTTPNQPVRLRVRLESTKVTFPNGDTRTVDVAQRVATITFRSEMRVTGSFPLRVVLETPDGATAFGEGTIVVRSTVVSAVTLAATGGGFLLLAISWFRRFLRDRRSKAAAGSG